MPDAADGPAGRSRGHRLHSLRERTVFTKQFAGVTISGGPCANTDYGFNVVLSRRGDALQFATANGTSTQTFAGIPQFLGIQDTTPFSSVTVTANDRGPCCSGTYRIRPP